MAVSAAVDERQHIPHGAGTSTMLPSTRLVSQQGHTKPVMRGGAEPHHQKAPGADCARVEGEQQAQPPVAGYRAVLAGEVANRRTG